MTAMTNRQAQRDVHWHYVRVIVALRHPTVMPWQVAKRTAEGQEGTI
jgi:hypothetical protein